MLISQIKPNYIANKDKFKFMSGLICSLITLIFQKVPYL